MNVHSIFRVSLGKFLGSVQGNRPYAMFLLAGFVSSVGFWLQNAAQYWIVVNLTHSGGDLAILSLCLYGPYAVFGLVGGALTDRFDRRRALIVSQLGLAACAGLLGACAAAGWGGVMPIFAISIVRSLILCVSLPSRQAFLRSIVDRDRFSNAVGLNASATNFARIIGPALAGLLIAAVGAWVCFALNAASYLAVVQSVRAIRVKAEEGGGATRASGRRLLRETLSGVAYICRVRHLGCIVLALLLVSFVAISFSTILPLYAQRSLAGGARLYGLLLSSLGFGAVIGSLYSGSLAARGMPLIFVSAAGIGTGEMLLMLHGGPHLAMGLLAFTGFWMTCFTTSINSVMMLDSPRELHGRVGAVYSYVVTGISPLGSALSGWLAEMGGPEFAFGVGGVVALVVGVIGIANSASLVALRNRTVE